MTHTKADLAVFIGRFQPFHIGHEYAIRRALELADHVLVLIGDTGGPPTIKNPWTFEQRATMIRNSFAARVKDKSLYIAQAFDFPYTEVDWIAQVQEIVREHHGEGEKVILVGHEKDSSSYYLRAFPQWKFIDTGYERFGDNLEHELRIDATEIRKLVFENRLHYAKGILNEKTLQFISDDLRTRTNMYEALRTEYKFINEYRQSWAAAPFPPVFVTTDAIVVQSGHVLLVERGQNPGKGLLALPGGFIDQAEGIDDCAIRELIEETAIKLQPDVLRRCIKHVQVFDRRGGVSQEDRGRIITHAHLIKLDDHKELPKVKGCDDAAQALWVPIGEINSRKMFSDHGHILHAMLGKL